MKIPCANDPFTGSSLQGVVKKLFEEGRSADVHFRVHYTPEGYELEIQWEQLKKFKEDLSYFEEDGTPWVLQMLLDFVITYLKASAREDFTLRLISHLWDMLPVKAVAAFRSHGHTEVLAHQDTTREHLHLGVALIKVLMEQLRYPPTKMKKMQRAFQAIL